MNNVMAHSLGVSRFLNWKALNAEGSAGGILLLWDRFNGRKFLSFVFV